MRDIITRYEQHFQHICEQDRPQEPQVENSKSAELHKEITDHTQQLRSMTGKDLEGLNIEGLQQMEKTIESGLKHVIEMKEKRILEEIGALQIKGMKLEEENKHLQQKFKFSQMAMLNKGKSSIPEDLDIYMLEGVSSKSMNNVCSCNSGLSLEDDSSDTLLKLGLPYPNSNGKM